MSKTNSSNDITPVKHSERIRRNKTDNNMKTNEQNLYNSKKCEVTPRTNKETKVINKFKIVVTKVIIGYV